MSSVLSFAMISPGVAAGARTPNHGFISNPQRVPPRCMVGTLGSDGERWRLVTPSARSLPEARCGATVAIGMNPIGTWPATRSVVAGALPL